MVVTMARLPQMRRRVAECARRWGLDTARTNNLVLAVHELAANAVRHGGGAGTLRAWLDGDLIYCRVTDHGPGLPAALREHLVNGQLMNPQPVDGQPVDGQFVGRPFVDQRRGDSGGWGLWLVHRLVDAVAIDTQPQGGTSVTLAVGRQTPAPTGRPARGPARRSVPPGPLRQRLASRQA
jgi:anti-sigma regulatory factor (Ser/Thr protein kinase)